MALDRYGYFSKDGREFVITRPDTPAPWVNYISNTRYTGLVSNTGGGYSYWMDPRDSRITRHRYNSLPWDRPGRYIYLKDEDGSYWSLSWQPTATDIDFYECRHGMGYTRIDTKYKGIAGSVTYFVPQDDDLEVWYVSLRNTRERQVQLSVYSYVELCLGHALVDLINQPNDQHFNSVFFEPKDQTLYATKNYWVTYRGATVKQPNQAWNKYVFFTTSLPITGWDGLKDAFIGKWRSESNPIGVERGSLGNTNITAGDACAATQSFIQLDPGQEVEFVVLLGCVDADDYRRNAVQIMRKYLVVENAPVELERIQSYWENYLSSSVVKTPDAEMNLMLNTWAKRQAWVTFNMNRNAGYYHGGLLFGVGVRDQCQDLMGPLMSEPEIVKDRIVEVLSHQFSDGSTLHNYFKLSGQGEKTGHSDTPLWLPLAVISYIKETADWDFLNKLVPFHDDGKATVLEHVVRAVEYALGSLTENNLPKFGPGDWNDTLDYVGREGRGESVWVAHFLCFILRETVELLKQLVRPNNAPTQHKIDIQPIIQKFELMYETVANAINSRCWDGEWYIRGTRDDGGVIGSSSNDEGRIFMNAQSWSVISGVAPNDRANTAMNSAYRHLDTARGPKILSPAYTKVDSGVGLATRCVPGKKENAAIFDHVVAWAILAECILGNGDRAYDYYRKTMPMIQAQDPDIYKMEPYVYSEYVTSPDHPTFGESSHSWLTGSGVWMLRVGLDYILGVRPSYEGLVIDPCIPKNWDEFKITRRFRGATYIVEVSNPEHVQRGVKSITIDGQIIAGNILPLIESGKKVDVTVIMGLVEK